MVDDPSAFAIKFWPKQSSNTKQIKAKTASIVEELNELNAMYKAGDITKAEFESAKRNLLGN